MMSDEVAKAQVAVPTGDSIFAKILRKEIPCEFIHEDDKVIYDLNKYAMSVIYTTSIVCCCFFNDEKYAWSIFSA